jgi:hypothetical protein
MVVVLTLEQNYTFTQRNVRQSIDRLYSNSFNSSGDACGSMMQLLHDVAVIMHLVR